MATSGETVTVPYVPGVVSIEISAVAYVGGRWDVKDVTAKVCYQPGMITKTILV